MGAVRQRHAHFDEDLERVFTLFPRLKERLQQRGGTLVGRRAADAGDRPRADEPAASLLLLDEPSLGLAPLIVKQIFDVIRELNEKDGMTVFLVEQNAYHALQARPSRLCHGQRQDHHERHRQGAAGRTRRSGPPISKAGRH